MSELTGRIEQIKNIIHGKGLQSLLDSIYQVLGNPLMMFDTEYKLLCHNCVPVDDPIWEEFLRFGVLSKKTQHLFDEEGFIEEVANAPVVAHLTTDKLKYDRFSGKIFNKNNAYVANVVLVASGRPFDKYDKKVFEVVCKLISKEISAIPFFLQYELAHQASIITSLLDGSINKKLDVAQVGILYDTLGHSLYVAVVLVPPCKSAADCLAEICKIKPKYKCAIFDGKIVMIISTNSDCLDGYAETQDLCELFERYKLYVGISGRFENLFELCRHYADALRCLQYVAQCRCSQRVFPYNYLSLDIVRQIEELKNGKGIQYFLDKGAKIFGNPVLFHDMELNLLGYSRKIDIDCPIWQELITYGTGSNETIELFRTENFVSIMDSTKGGALLVSDKIKYDRISWRIYNGEDVRIGCTSMVNTLRPFCADELVLFGLYSIKFCNEVEKIEFYNDYGRVYTDTIINRLLSGKIDEYTFYSEDIGNLYNNLMDSLYLVVIDKSRCNNKDINLTYFKKLFNWQGMVNRYAVYCGQTIVIISTTGAPLGKREEFSRVIEAFEQHNIFAGISSRFCNICDAQKYYKQAANALALALNGGEGRCVFADE